MPHYLYFLLILTTSLLTACAPKIQTHHDTLLAFGTLIDVTLVDTDKETARQAFQYIREDLKIMHSAWHVWQPGPLMRENRLLQTKIEFSASPSTLDLIVKAKALSLKSQGLFNPAIGKLIALWGFHSDEYPETPPAKEDILALLKKNPSMEDISINGIRMISRNDAVKLDFGGVAKGFAIDRLLKGLRQRGINNALINTGGDLKVIGQQVNRPWLVAIREPRIKDGVLATIELKNNEAAFTSGDYERHLKSKQNNNTYLHHIIDPRTGYPAIGSQSVTVLHQDAALADAAATALFIAGPKDWVRIAKAMGIKYALLIDEKGQLHLSEAMQKRLKLESHHNIAQVVRL